MLERVPRKDDRVEEVKTYNVEETAAIFERVDALRADARRERGFQSGADDRGDWNSVTEERAFLAQATAEADAVLNRVEVPFTAQIEKAVIALANALDAGDENTADLPKDLTDALRKYRDAKIVHNDASDAANDPEGSPYILGVPVSEMEDMCYEDMLHAGLALIGTWSKR
jgi:Asp-tRNA(Asn)/Glu-tRNA(Gln) amidotransferase C subunit